MKMKLSVLALASTAFAFGVAGSASALPVNNNNATQTVNARGSDTTFGMDQKLSNVYAGSEGCVADTGNATQALWATCAASQPATAVATENYDHDVPVQYDPQTWGSGKGLSSLCNQTSAAGTGLLADVQPTELARSSRPPVSTDCTGLLARGYAKDAIVPINWRNQAGSPAAGVNNLSLAQLQGIFRDCTITNWNQIGSLVSAPIVVWGIQTGSGTYKAFANAIGATGAGFPSGANKCVTPGDPDGTGPLASRIVQENDAQQVLAANAVTPGESGNSIWFMSYGPWQSNLNLRGQSSFTAINGIGPSGTTITNGTYLTDRFLYMVTRPGTLVAGHDANRAAATDFVSWVCANSTTHTSALNKPYAAQITSAITSEGFYRNADSSGTGATDTCTNVTT
jgi:ABC-type phosphate transport system substrate-binding protein